MPVMRCDFLVESDLVIDSAVEQYAPAAANEYQFVYRNAPPDTKGNLAHLAVTAIGPTSSYDEAHEELRAQLARQLDVLGFVSHARFKIIRPRRSPCTPSFLMYVMGWPTAKIQKRCSRTRKSNGTDCCMFLAGSSPTQLCSPHQ